VRVGDHVGLSQRVVDLLCDDKRRERMGAAAAKRQRTHFPLELMLAKINMDLAYLSSYVPDSSRGAAARELLNMSTRSLKIRVEERIEFAADRTVNRLRRARRALWQAQKRVP
jgi:hypothetical protein